MRKGYSAKPYEPSLKEIAIQAAAAKEKGLKRKKLATKSKEGGSVYGSKRSGIRRYYSIPIPQKGVVGWWSI